MNLIWIPWGIFLILLQLLPFGQRPPEKPEIKTPAKGWWMVSYFGVPPTRYSRDRAGIIKAESLGTRSSLFKEVKEKEINFPVLSWRWKISNVVRSAIETRKDRFDTAARVIVVFGSRQRLLPIEGTEPSGHKIEYIWSNRLPKGKIFDPPSGSNGKVWVLESGDGKAGTWLEEVRNLRHDFKEAFGTDPPELFAIGIQTNTDHSNERVTTYYSDPLLKKK